MAYMSNRLSAGQVPVVFNSMQTRQSSRGVPHLIAVAFWWTAVGGHSLRLRSQSLFGHRHVSTRCHSACCWSNFAPSTCLHYHSLLWCQQHVVHHLETEPLWLLDHMYGTVYLSSSLTARHFSPSRNISRLIYLVYLF